MVWKIGMGNLLSDLSWTKVDFYYRKPDTKTDFGRHHPSQSSFQQQLSQQRVSSESLSGDFQGLSFNETSTSCDHDSSSSSTTVFGDRGKIQESYSDDDVFSCNEKGETNIAQDTSVALGTLCLSRDHDLAQNDTDNDDYNIEDLCRDMIEQIVPPKSDGAKVVILNVEDDETLAKELANHLCTKFGCRAAAIKSFNALYSMCGPQALAAVQKWADILLMIISPASIRAIKIVQPTHRADVETTKYHFSLIQAEFMHRCSINSKVVAVIKPGTDPSSYSGIIELRNSCSVDDIIENFPSVIEFMKVSKRGMEMVKNTLRRLEGNSTEGKTNESQE